MRGINYGHHLNSGTYRKNTVYAEMRAIYEAGYRAIRIAQPTYNSSAGTLTMCRDLVAWALDVGFDEVHWGVVGARPVTSTSWTAYSTYVTGTLAPWAQTLANSRLHLGIGNEEELHVDGTTITVSTLQNNLKSLATSVQAIYTHGPIVYVTDATQRTAWASLGLGNIDRLGMNLYYEMSAVGGFKGAAEQILASFPTTSFITEWGIAGGCPTVEAKGATHAEDNFAAHMFERQQILEGLEVDHFVFAFGDGAFGVTANQWGLRTTSGTYRKAWYKLTGTRDYSTRLSTATSVESNPLDSKADATHTHDASDIIATGTADGTTYLRGDGAWAVPAGGGGGAVDSVNGDTGVVVLNQDDIADGTTYKQFSQTEKTKLSGIANGATANDTDANLKNRANHTGTQAASTISDFSMAADARITAATGVSVQEYNASTTTLGNATTGTGLIVRGTAPNITAPTGIVKADVGLSNVDNTSDASKPVSTAQQAALDLKSNTTHSHAVTGFTAFGTGGIINVLNVSSGTSVSPVAGSIYWAAVLIPFSVTLTGIIYSIGSGATAGNVIVALYSSAGTLLANSTLSGTAIGTASTKQKVAFTSTYSAAGPGVFYIVLQFSANTTRFLAFANATEGFVTGSTTGTFGTLGSITPGSTYTVNVGPYASTY